MSVAYKNSVGSRRTAWRTVSAIQQKEEYKVSWAYYEIKLQYLMAFELTICNIGLKIRWFDQIIQIKDRKRTWGYMQRCLKSSRRSPYSKLQEPRS